MEENRMKSDQRPQDEAIDVVGVQPLAKEIVRAAARVYLTHLGSALVTLVAHGSAVKGGVIIGSSDVDLVALVAPALPMPKGELPVEQALDLHRDLANIDPSPFRYLQGHVYPDDGRPGPRFIPGTYHVVWGAREVPLATSEELLAAAETALRALDPVSVRAQISSSLLDHGGGRLFAQVRLLCTKVWPLLYDAACLQQGDGVWAWQRQKSEIIALLNDDPLIGPTARRWMNAVVRHYAGEETVDTALDVIAAGIACVDAAAQWAHDCA
jgi:hypothetical protein